MSCFAGRAADAVRLAFLQKFFLRVNNLGQSIVYQTESQKEVS